MAKLFRDKNILIYLAIIYFLGCKAVEKEEIINTIPPDTTSSISFSIVGDLMCHSTQFQYAQVSADSFYFDNVYKYVKPLFDSSDFVMGNFESVTAGDSIGYKGYPRFNTPDDFITSLKRSGFDIIFTSNNHCYDRWQKGLQRTIKTIKKNSLEYSGTFSSKKDSDSIRVYKKNGISFSLLSYTYGTNGFKVSDKYKFSVNVIDTTQIKLDLWKARKLNPDFVMVYFHFGNEYSTYPSKYQKEIVDKTFKHGADLIVASHPHVIQPIKILSNNNSKFDSSFVAYSLGNFVSNQRWRYSDCGMILQFDIVKNHKNNKTNFSNLSYTPTWVFKGRDNGKKEYYILPTKKYLNDKTIKFLRKADRDSMKKSLRDTRRILKRYSKITEN